MGKRIGNLLIVSGILSMLFAFLLFVRNEREALLAERQSQQILARMTDAWADRALQHGQLWEQPQPLMIDGQEYMGYLSVPTLELEMPILSDWSSDKLKLTSCRYSGSLEQGDLVIMGHDYRNGFGKLSRLRVGDTVSLKAADGSTRIYTVKAVEVLSGDAVNEMKNSGYDLTLFTCVNYGENRLTVRCRES